MTPEQRAVEEFKAKVRAAATSSADGLSWGRAWELLKPAEPEPTKWMVDAVRGIDARLELRLTEDGIALAANILAKHAEGLVEWMRKLGYRDAIKDIESYLRGER